MVSRFGWGASCIEILARRNHMDLNLRTCWFVLGVTAISVLAAGAARDGSVVVKTPNVPYGTRILTYRPADPAKFSGCVDIELLNAVRRVDWAWAIRRILS
jgi:hypothetical protein